MNNKDLEQMILQELVLQPILEFIVDKFAEELLKEDEEEEKVNDGCFSPGTEVMYLNQGQSSQEVSALSDGSGLKTPCVGSYPASGYTRSDGTEVKPYTRTCGAKHLAQEKEKKEKQNVTGGASRVQIEDYYNYNLIPNLESYNKADTVNMTEEEMNKFRHIAGSAQAMQDLEFIDAIKAIFGKEILDISQDGLKDTLYDLKNDLKALKLYFEHHNLTDEELYNYVFTKYILPHRK